MNVEAIDPDVRYDIYPQAVLATTQCDECRAYLNSYSAAKQQRHRVKLCMPCESKRIESTVVWTVEADPQEKVVVTLTAEDVMRIPPDLRTPAQKLILRRARNKKYEDAQLAKDAEGFIARRNARHLKAKHKKATAFRAQTAVDGVKYLDVPQVAWCLGMTTGGVMSQVKLGHLKRLRGNGFKSVFAIEELERWREVYA